MMMIFSFCSFVVETDVELDCELVDQILAQENSIALTKKETKAYELNKHFQDTWAIKLLWVKFDVGSNGKVVQIWYKVYSLIESKDKLVVTNLDSLWTHAGHSKVLVSMLGVQVGQHHFGNM